MYTMAIHAQQVMSVTMLTVSLTETQDDGSTYTIATALASSDLLGSADEDPYWIFVQQINDCLSRTISEPLPGASRTARSDDGVDGGWRGAGNPGQPEQSEDQC